MNYLHLNTWAGHTKHLIKIINETKKHYRVELMESCIKGPKGHQLLVPKWAISEVPEPEGE